VHILVTGSSGLIGSEAVEYFARRGHDVDGLDNNMRADFFGPQGDTAWRLEQLVETVRNFTHHAVDIRDRTVVMDVFAARRIGAVIHCAAQPSHDLAKDRPFDDFDVNATGTLNLLEAARRYCPEAPFVFMSTNKVYGDVPNELPLVELPTRWDYADPAHYQGIDETMRIDRSKHSLFGASKAAADLMVQEYGRYFEMPTASQRGRAARVSQLPRQDRLARQDVHDLRLQGQAGARPDSQPRRGARLRGIHRGAARGRGL
jgi:CDP-paratose 2-epimerase